MCAIPVARPTKEPDVDGLGTLARLATESHEVITGDRDATIAQLQALARRHQAVIDTLAQGVCFFDSEERLILSNRRYAEIYRLAPEQVRPGATLREIIELRVAAGTYSAAAADADLSFCAANSAAKEETIWTAELRDGRNVQIRRQPLSGGGWVSTHEDVTDFNAPRASANLRLSLQALIDWVPDYLWVKDTETRFVVVNKALAIDSGCAKTSDMIGLTDFDLHAPEAAQEFRAIEQNVIPSGKPMIDREELVVDRSGVKMWLSSTKVPVRDDGDETVGLVGIARNITARKLADALRDEQAQILEMIAMSVPLGEVLDASRSSHRIPVRRDCRLRPAGRRNGRPACGPAPRRACRTAYAKAIDGVRIGPKAGSSGTAAYRRETVVVADVMTDPLWERLQELAPSRSDFVPAGRRRSCRIRAQFSAYSRCMRRNAREPTDAEMRLVDVATRIAGIAIERKLAEDRIHFMANHDALTGLPNRTLLERSSVASRVACAAIRPLGDSAVRRSRQFQTG